MRRRAVPAFLAVPHRALTGFDQRSFWKLLIGRLEFLQTHNIGPPLAKKLKRAGVDKSVRGRPGASDHAPVGIELK